MKKEKVIIIGSGPAGLTAGIYTARADFEPLIFEGMTPGGQLTGTTDLENFPGFPDGIQGPEFMNRIREQAKKFGARTIIKNIDKVDFSDEKNLKLWAGETEYSAETVIIATGASARWLNLGKGEERFRGRGYSSCATCDGAFFRGKIVGVVGGGDTACEEASFLTKFAEKVYLIYRGPKEKMRASKPMLKRVFNNPKIEVILNENVTDLKGETLLEAVELTNSETGKKSELKLNGLFVAIGTIPNTKFLEGQIELERGFVKVYGKSGTNVPSVFVAGDVSDPHYKQAIIAAGHGAIAALDAQAYLESLND